MTNQAMNAMGQNQAQQGLELRMQPQAADWGCSLAEMAKSRHDVVDITSHRVFWMFLVKVLHLRS